VSAERTIAEALELVARAIGEVSAEHRAGEPVTARGVAYVLGAAEANLRTAAARLAAGASHRSRTDDTAQEGDRWRDE
jgi:hypothetical protein